jgi:hypothetical protein
VVLRHRACLEAVTMAVRIFRGTLVGRGTYKSVVSSMSAAAGRGSFSGAGRERVMEASRSPSSGRLR